MRVRSSGRVLERAAIAPLQLEVKEGLALLNGTQAMGAVGALALHRAERLVPVQEKLRVVVGNHLGTEDVQRSPEVGAVHAVVRLVRVRRPLVRQDRVRQDRAAGERREREEEDGEAQDAPEELAQRSDRSSGCMFASCVRPGLIPFRDSGREKLTVHLERPDAS